VVDYEGKGDGQQLICIDCSGNGTRLDVKAGTNPDIPDKNQIFNVITSETCPTCQGTGWQRN
jgi:hypothetical protein